MNSTTYFWLYSVYYSTEEASPNYYKLSHYIQITNYLSAENILGQIIIGNTAAQGFSILLLQSGQLNDLDLKFT